MMNILKSHKLWARDAMFLNDSGEVKIGRDYMKQWLQCNDDALDGMNKTAHYILNSMVDLKMGPIQNTVSAFTRPKLFSCSFSTESDSVSQWRGYGSGDIGYSIGLHLDHIIEIQELNQLDFVECEYDHSPENNPICKILDQKLREGFFHDFHDLEEDRLVTTNFIKLGQLRSEIFNKAILLKCPTFSDEKEWRLIPKTVPDLDDIDFANNHGIMMPHLKYKIFSDNYTDTRKPIITIGPSNNQPLAYAGLDLFIKKHVKRPRIDIQKSKTSFRNW